MKYALICGYEFLSEFLPCLAVLLLMRRKPGRFGAARGKGLWLAVVFALYVTAVFHITWPGTLYDSPEATAREVLGRMNLLPFSRDISVRGYVLNAVMFLPFGLLLPLLGRGRGRFLSVLGAGFGFSLLIELSQILSQRGTDVDDLIMNTLGAALGFGLYKVLDRFTRSRFRAGLTGGGIAVCILSLYLGRFLLFYRAGLVRLLYD